MLSCEKLKFIHFGEKDVAEVQRPFCDIRSRPWTGHPEQFVHFASVAYLKAADDALSTPTRDAFNPVSIMEFVSQTHTLD
jgi:hypothetical protein